MSATQIEFNAKAYFEYYVKHTSNVVLAWSIIRDFLIEERVINENELEKINNLVVWHDNSKINLDEFSAYALRFYPCVGKLDEKNQKLIKNNFKKACKIHKKSNLHHHETLKNYQGKDLICYVIEMICDWIAMGWETDFTALQYYEMKKEELELPKATRQTVEKILELINKKNSTVYEPKTEKEKIRLWIRKI
jgi:hypothetical protein